jgi:CBS domain-containing protein
VNIADILRHKGGDVWTIAPGDSVSTLLGMLADHNVGALLVADGERVAGIVSERDVVRRIAERGPDVLDATVRDIMTTSVVSCSSADSLDSIAETMTERRVRHMPVIDDGRLVGVISIGDVVSARMRQLAKDREQLEQYITS